jgi:arginyl-tRNA synthetase
MREEYLLPLFKEALNKIGISEGFELFFEEPKNPEHGDVSTNIAMQLAKPLKKPPIKIAEEIINNLNSHNDFIESVNIAGAGFINIKFTNLFYTEEFKKLVEIGETIGKQNIYKGKKVNVEYVSVNPTGLLHLGHGRNAAIGDTIANLHEWLGWDVTREYYFNNAGFQMQMLAKSIYARYMQSLGNADFPFPDDGYHGDYITDIASELKNEFGDVLKAGTDEDLTKCRQFGEKWCFSRIEKTLIRMNVHQDVYYNEDSLYSDGKITKLIEDLRNEALVYEKEGATWLALTKLGLKDDRVIVKSTGEPTYRLPDIAYHRTKFERGFDLMIDIFGADHIATVPDVLAGVTALGLDSSKVKVLIHQFVTLTDNGEQVKMSKRSGKSYTLDDLLDEVGSDVVRFFLLMRGISTHLEFDLALAREQSDKNPVFYLQYAHARICSIFETARDRGIQTTGKSYISLLEHPAELDLIKTLMKFNDVLKDAGDKCEPQILAEYLRNVAAAFHTFYHECRIIGIKPVGLMHARFLLADVSRHVLRNGLKILGISAPERM